MTGELRDNPLECRADFVRAAMKLLEPLPGKLTPGKAGLRLGESGALYGAQVARMEGFSRALWAIVPLLASDTPEVGPLWTLWREGIVNGVDPLHPEYFGDIGPSDQRMVEMAAPAMGLLFARARFWDALGAAARENLATWLGQINLHDMPTNNWRFFRVLVNSAFRRVGLPFSEERLAEDFALIESHYEGDGWYFDYENQREYYTPWGYHFYGLLYAATMREFDPERCDLFIERAKLFAPRFLHWFDADAEALPYGRSLAYRFAQVSFFSAMALAGVEAEGICYPEMRFLIAQHLRNWFRRPILDAEGLLTIGYGYPNLNMAEGYNAPGSPYWGLKAFACLALPEAHPFWQAQERPVNPPDGLFHEPHARMLISRSAHGKHVVAYTAGNHAEGHAHDESKYEKFAYSTRFAFSVTKCAPLLMRGAYDSMLALSLDGRYWHPRYGCERFEISEAAVNATWCPFPDVRIETEIRPFGDWHVRRHRITTDRKLYAAEGGFAILRERDGEEPRSILEKDGCCALSPWGISGIRAVTGYEKAKLLAPEPNTNLLHPRTLLPTLLVELPAGEHELVSMVLGTPLADETIWTKPPREVLDVARRI